MNYGVIFSILENRTTKVEQPNIVNKTPQAKRKEYLINTMRSAIKLMIM